MNDPVRWGVLGCANIALTKVLPAMQRAQACDVVAIASRDGDRARRAADALGISRHYGSYEELLGDPEIEAVYIPLPNHLHAQWTLAAAAAGKHVLCEKPLAMSVAEAERMIESCEKAGVLLMEAFMYRLHPLWEKTRELIAGGVIGKLRAIQTFFSYRNLDPANIRNVAAYGGGALMDIGCYAIDVARMMFAGEPASVSGLVHRDATFGTDVLTSAMLDFDGRHATFTCSTHTVDEQRVHLVGTEGRLLVEIPFNIPPDRPTRILRFWGGDPPVAPNQEVFEVPAADQYGVQGDAFSQAVRRGGPVPTPPGNGIGNLAVIEQILRPAP
jgi:predicted dehydrogenase